MDLSPLGPESVVKVIRPVESSHSRTRATSELKLTLKADSDIFILFLPNVPDQEFPLASGGADAPASAVPEVPKAAEFAASVCSVFLLSFQFMSAVWTMEDT